MILLSFVDTTHHFKTCFYFFFYFPFQCEFSIQLPLLMMPGYTIKWGWEMERDWRMSCWQHQTFMYLTGRKRLWIFIHNFVPVVSAWEEEDGWLNLRATAGSKSLQREEQGQWEESWDTLPLSASFTPKGRVTYLGKAFLRAAENVWQLGDCEEGSSS